MSDHAWSPAELLKMSGSYWEACALHAGVKLDVFTALMEGPSSAPDLAVRLDCDSRGLFMLLDALAALDLLVKKRDMYSLTSFAAEFLSRQSEGYLGHIIRHHHHLVEGWAKLDEVVRSGQTVRRRISHDGEEAERESFLLGMYNLAMLLAPQVVGSIDLGGRRRLLDLGGGPGTYAIHFCLHNPELRATVFDLPTTRPFAEATIERFGLASRIGFAAGDFQYDPLPGRYDAVWLSHVLHGEGEAGCARLLTKAAAVMEPGGVLLVQEFILADSRDKPLFPALFSLNMLLGTPDGKAYSEGEIRDLLEAAGLEQVERLPLALPNGAGVVRARKAG